MLRWQKVPGTHTTMDVFLSYNRADAVHAEALNGWLVGQGVKTFFDRRDLGSGQLWLTDLERAIEHEAQSVAVLVGPHGIGNTQQYEYQLALTRQAKDKDFPLIPVVLPGIENWQLPRGFLGLQTWVSFADVGGVTAGPAQLQRLLAAIRREHPDSDTIRGTICPYKGLEAFAEEDAALFFGRDDEAAELHRTVLAHGVAAMIGRSGTGKSSLVRAGLLPRLRRRDAAGPGTVWDSLILRPGTSPLTELARVLSPGPADEDGQDRFRRLERQAAEWRTDRPDTLARFLRDRMGQARLRVNRLLVVVDQAEELFARPWHVRDAVAEKAFRDDAEQFIKLLLGAADEGAASVALTIRSDYFDPLMHSPLGPVLKETLVQLGRIGDLRPSIERPAAAVGLTFSPGLVEQIVAEVGADESNLPLLQHALQRTWELRPRGGPVMSADAYTESGGVAKAINQAAQACFDGLSAEEQAAAKRLFLRLVRPGEGNAHLRQRTPVPDDPVEQRVMDAFAAPDRRLLFIGMNAGRRQVEVAHEALVRGWPTLLEWVETSRERLRARDDVLQWLAQPETTPEMMPARRLVQRADDLLRDPGDVPVDDLRAIIERWVRRERWQRNRTRMIAGVVIVALTGLSAAALLEWRSSAEESRHAEIERGRAETERNHAEANLAIARDAASGLIFDLAQGLRDQTGVPVSALRKILDQAMTVLDKLTANSPDDNAMLQLRAAALEELSITYASVGDTERQRDTAEQSATLWERLTKSAPGDVFLQRELSVSYDRVGDVLVDQGNMPAALKSYQDSQAIRDRLARTDPGNTGWQRDASVSDDNVGDVLLAQGNSEGALTSYRDSLAIRDRLARTDPGNTGWQRDVSVSNDRVGNVLVAQGKLSEALTSYRDSMGIRERLAKADPGNAGWQRDLSVSDDRLGNVLVAQGKLSEALTSYRDSMGIRERLAKADPGNAGWQRDLSVSYDRVGDVLVAQGNLPEALRSYHDSIAIRDRLAEADPGNAGWQRDLSVSYDQVGDVLAAQDDLTEALKSYHDSAAIRDRLAKAYPGNAGWQRDLAVSYNKVGDVLVAQGNLRDALQSYRDSLAISRPAGRRRTRATPNGSAISRSRTIGLATFRWPRANCRRR